MSVNGVFRVVIQVDGRDNPALFVLKDGDLTGFDLENTRFRGTYREDAETNDLLVNAELSYPVSLGVDGAIVREKRAFTIRVPQPPDIAGSSLGANVPIGTTPDERKATLVIERLSQL